VAVFYPPGHPLAPIQGYPSLPVGPVGPVRKLKRPRQLPSPPMYDRRIGPIYRGSQLPSIHYSRPIGPSYHASQAIVDCPVCLEPIQWTPGNYVQCPTGAPHYWCATCDLSLTRCPLCRALLPGRADDDEDEAHGRSVAWWNYVADLPQLPDHPGY
jgi:hypothetical protein